MKFLDPNLFAADLPPPEGTGAGPSVEEVAKEATDEASRIAAEEEADRSDTKAVGKEPAAMPCVEVLTDSESNSASGPLGAGAFIMTGAASGTAAGPSTSKAPPRSRYIRVGDL